MMLSQPGNFIKNKKNVFCAPIFFSWNSDQLKHEERLNLRPVDGLSGTATPYLIIYNVPGTALLYIILGVTVDMQIERGT